MNNRDEDLMYLIGSFISEKDKLDEMYMQQCDFSDEEDDSEASSNMKLAHEPSPVGKTFYQGRYSQQTSPDEVLGDVLEQIDQASAVGTYQLDDTMITIRGPI
jgi:hypothetical protein